MRTLSCRCVSTDRLELCRQLLCASTAVFYGWLNSGMNTSRPALQVSGHGDLSAARVSRWSVGMWNFFSVAFMWSEKCFFWPPCDREPWRSSPYSTWWGRRLDAILMTWLSYRSCLCMTVCSVELMFALWLICTWAIMTANQFLITDSAICLPGFDLERKDWTSQLFSHRP